MKPDGLLCRGLCREQMYRRGSVEAVVVVQTVLAERVKIRGFC